MRILRPDKSACSNRSSQDKKPKPDITFFGGIAFLWKYIKKYRFNFAMFYLGWFVETLLSLATPIIFAVMIDQIVYYRDMTAFLRISAALAVVTLFSSLLFFLIYTYDLIIKSVYTFDIKLDIFKRLQTINSQYMCDAKTGDVMQLINGDSFECAHFVVRNVFHFVNGIISCLFYVVYMFVINPYAGLLMLVCTPVSAAVSMRFGKKIRSYADERRNIYGGYLGWLVEMLRGIKDIRLLTAERSVVSGLIRQHRNIFRVSIKTAVTAVTADRVIKLCNLIVQLAIFVAAAYLTASGSITIGVFTVMIAFFILLRDGIIRLSQNNMDSQNRLACIKRIRDFMNEPTEQDWKGTSKLTVTNGAVTFKSVDFTYDRQPVLNKLDLDIHPGEKLALIGKSGCGKSTIASLLIGLFKVNGGEILIDGQALADCTLRSIRDSIGVVQQDVLIFDGTIRENLLLAKRDAADGELWSACEKAGIADFLRGYPNGLDTVVGKDGVGLSGGQKQRLAIARIYIKNAPIIIFDEATSALDHDTELAVHQAWRDLLKNRTAIIIAHRQSSVMLCDRAALIENGNIAVSGEPSELSIHNEKFMELFAISNAEGGEAYV